MAKSDYGSSAHLTSPSCSRPTSKTHSIDRDCLSGVKPATLNVLFLGETSIGDSLIINFAANSVEQSHLDANPRTLGSAGSDMQGIALDGKRFMLYSLAISYSTSVAALRKSTQEILVFLRKNGGVHLLVYCMNALRPVKWIHEIHHTIVSDTTLSSIPAVAVIVGVSDVAEQESWWTSTNDVLAEHGPRFDDHIFLPVMTAGTLSLSGGHTAEIRRALHEIILKNVDSETDSDFQRVAFYKQRSPGNSFRSLRIMLARSSLSHTHVDSRAFDIVLLGGIGVGKSSLINLIARAKVAEASSDAVGCTKAVTKYSFEDKGRVFHIYDTPGLVDPQMGDKAFIDPIDTIQRLIRSLGNGNGPDLLLFCIDNSKPTEAIQRNRYIFHDFICGGKVPFALAVTKLEQDADQWWSEYGATIRKYGIDRSSYIGLGWEKRHLGLDVDAEALPRESLLSFLVTCADRQKSGAVTLSLVRSSMERVASFVRSQAWKPETILINQYGLEERTTRELVNRMVCSKNKVHPGFLLLDHMYVPLLKLLPTSERRQTHDLATMKNGLAFQVITVA